MGKQGSNIQDVFIIGATGNVGKKVVEKLVANTNHPARIVGVASTAHWHYNQRGISDADALAFAHKEDGNGRFDSYDSWDDFLNAPSIGKRRTNSLVFIDATAQQDTALKFHLDVIEDTDHGIVTMNKNPLALGTYDDFTTLTSDPIRYGFEPTVMAGAGVIDWANSLYQMSAIPTKISGVFSGTMGYICSELQKERLLSDIVAQAKKGKITEPDPRDDLNGVDIGRKLLIVARTLGIPLEMSDVAITPFVDQKYFDVASPDEFIAGLKDLDSHMLQDVQHWASEQKALRYVARMSARRYIAGGAEKPRLVVEREVVPYDSPLGQLSGTDNKFVAVIPDIYPANAPYQKQAPGAGVDVTAFNTIRNLRDLIVDPSATFARYS